MRVGQPPARRGRLLVTVLVLLLAVCVTGLGALRAAGASTQTLSGVAWKSGVFGHGKVGGQRALEFEAMRGKKLDLISVFPARDSWEAINDTWYLRELPAGFSGQLEIGMPLFPKDGNLSTAAAGGYNQQWTDWARMIAEKYPQSYVRPGWEMNINNWYWAATEGNAAQWKAAFKNAATSIKAGAPSLKVAWIANAGVGNSLADATKVYPEGDDSYIDVIGIDSYDWWPAYTASTWPQHRDGEGGWAFWMNFAQKHQKKFAVPEWGVAPGNDNGGGDNPFYIQMVYEFLAENAAWVEYECYFEEKDAYIASWLSGGANPKAAAQYTASLAAVPKAGSIAVAQVGQPLDLVDTAPQEWAWDPGVKLWGLWAWNGAKWTLVRSQPNPPAGKTTPEATPTSGGRPEAQQQTQTQTQPVQPGVTGDAGDDDTEVASPSSSSTAGPAAASASPASASPTAAAPSTSGPAPAPATPAASAPSTPAIADTPRSSSSSSTVPAPAPQPLSPAPAGPAAQASQGSAQPSGQLVASTSPQLQMAAQVPAASSGQPQRAGSSTTGLEQVITVTVTPQVSPLLPEPAPRKNVAEQAWQIVVKAVQA